ncbi:DUF1307 domain-containing protein [Staphylococcus simulans]|uniref:DUF1307 domain-containing protein n=1 Tax=Staphylococcus simulans TaxID=1286 RepID=UPI001E4D7068|nr:DUF1307 domain-containing protein [Staphylococcus simulans]MCD8915593.1 DUF1307 domain-containing protein [Staphylococcus simulans]
MKRGLLLLGALFMSIVVLAACDKAQSKTYEGHLSGADVIDTLTYKGDKMVKQSMIMTIRYDTNGLTKKDAKAILDKQEQVYKGQKGIQYSKSIKDDKAVQKVDIDYKKADLDKLAHTMGVTGPKSGKDYVDVKAVERSLKKAGFKVKKPLNDQE